MAAERIVWFLGATVGTEAVLWCSGAVMLGYSQAIGRVGRESVYGGRERLRNEELEMTDQLS